MGTTKSTIVIAGFPAIGKSYIYRNQGNVIVQDSDSSKFDKAHFPGNYIEHIKARRGEVDYLLVSTHKVVREALLAEGIPFVQVMPNPTLKAEYLERCRLRGSPEAMITFLDTNWDSFFDDGAVSPHYIQLEAGEYLLDRLDEVEAAMPKSAT